MREDELLGDRTLPYDVEAIARASPLAAGALLYEAGRPASVSMRVFSGIDGWAARRRRVIAATRTYLGRQPPRLL